MFIVRVEQKAKREKKEAGKRERLKRAREFYYSCVGVCQAANKGSCYSSFPVPLNILAENEEKVSRYSSTLMFPQLLLYYIS